MAIGDFTTIVFFLLVTFCSNYTNRHVFIYVCTYINTYTLYDSKEQKWAENFKKHKNDSKLMKMKLEE